MALLMAGYGSQEIFLRRFFLEKDFIIIFLKTFLRKEKFLTNFLGHGSHGNYI